MDTAIGQLAPSTLRNSGRLTTSGATTAMSDPTATHHGNGPSRRVDDEIGGDLSEAASAPTAT
jgi:hypothetical protein